MTTQDGQHPGPGYGAVILYYRLGATVLESLQAVHDQSVAPMRIVLVDNASNDGVLDQLEADGQLDGAEVLRCEVNGGYSAGMNAGFHHLGASVDYILFMTHEVTMEPTCVERMLAESQLQHTVLTGPSLHLPGGSVWSNGGRVTVLGSATHVRTVSRRRGKSVSWLDGACMLARRDAVEAIGGFDERYFLYWEDVDFSMAMAAKGDVVVVPQAVAYQSPSADAPMYYYSRNRLLLWRKYGRLLRAVGSVPGILAYAVVRRGRGHRGDVGQALRGIRDGLFNRTGPDPQRITPPPSA